MTNKFPWVPVVDESGNSRLPEKSGSYLVTMRLPYMVTPEIEIMSYIAESGVWVDAEGNEYDTEEECVTAWAIAPDPYEGAK